MLYQKRIITRVVLNLTNDTNEQFVENCGRLELGAECLGS